MGIFLVNMISFHSPILYIDPHVTWTTTSDHVFYMLIDLFIQGSIYPLFSFLFGYGFIILRERTMAKGESFPAIAIRRLLFLLLIGWAHANYIWHGDILFTYSLFGFLLLLFIRLSGKVLVLLGIILYFVPNVVITILMILASSVTGNGDFTMANETSANASYNVYQMGTFEEISEQRSLDWYLVNNPGNMFFMLFSIFPMFLIGGGAAKEDWLRRGIELTRPFQVTLAIALLIGISIKSSPYWIPRNWATEYAQDMLGGPLLSISYILIIVLITNNHRGLEVLKVFGPVGKLSFTNYLVQSLVSTTIFYSYGLGLYGQVSVVEGTILALMIFLIQLIYSYIWLKYFRIGPFEWVWRSVSYWQWQKIRKEGDIK
ncbi:DUF418 domain-containing protein [Robertmurraya korlensis]|uniref:DUF418 domain-containing protein n=1 Tax=Robertmurraya korlensis TaxID=519977 RepID=UPI000A88F369|nr:DUF418 domain-containing protein [Robertmurraya korlensis]